MAHDVVMFVFHSLQLKEMYFHINMHFHALELVVIIMAISNPVVIMKTFINGNFRQQYRLTDGAKMFFLHRFFLLLCPHPLYNDSLEFN